MKVLFVHLGREHLGIEYLSAILREGGHETALAADIGLFGQNDNIFYIPRLERCFDLSSAIIGKFKKYDPDLVCFSAYSTTLQWCFSIASKIKKIKNVTTMIGGAHITLVPESAMMCESIDYGFHGEAETVICGIANRIESGLPLDDVPGVVFRREGGVVINDPADLVTDLDTLPLPDKSVFEHVLNISDDYMTLTTRGCAYNCTFCCEHIHKKMYGGAFHRLRRVDALIEELVVMKQRYRYSEVYFVSPVFPGKMAWIEDFCGKYSARIGIPFWCFGHVNHFSLEYATLLKKAGCRNVEFGIQTLNEDLRSKLMNRRETNDRLREVIGICDKAGIGYDFDIIFDLPGECEQDYIDTVEMFSGGRNIHRIKTYHLVIFPRTEIADHAMKEGYISEAEHRAMEEGEVGDFMHVPSIGCDMEAWKRAGYERVLRLLPFLPRRMTVALLKPKRLKAVARAPMMVIKTIELMNVALKKDLRLLLYLKIYIRHGLRFITGRRKP